MARKRLFLSLSEAQYEAIIQFAEKEKVPASALMTSIVLEHIGMNKTSAENRIIDADNEITNKRKLTFHLNNEDARVLHEKAAQLGFSDVAYIRKLIHTKDFKLYDIKEDDIYEFMELINKAVHDISSFVGSIKKFGQKKIYEQDIKQLEQYSEEIIKLLKQQVKLTYANRERAYNQMIGKE